MSGKYTELLNEPIPSQGDEMPKANTVKEVVARTSHAKTEPPRKSIQSAAQELADLDVEAEALDGRIAQLKKQLKADLGKLPESERKVPVLRDGVEENLCLESGSVESFDWESAKETLSKTELKKLLPFVKTTEKLELAAASKLVDMTKYKKFVDVRPTAALQFRKPKAEES